MHGNLRLILVVCLHFILADMAFTGSIHVLSRGDTLYSLARRYDVTVAELLKENSITDPSSLSIGTRLLIPDSANPNPPEYETYKVVKGDTYYSIARRFNMTVKTLQRINMKSENQLLTVGEILKVDKTIEAADIRPAYLTGVSQANSVPWWPVAGKIRPLEGKLSGVSIEAVSMSYIHAVAAGSVVWTGPYREFGNVVLIDSGSYIYLYGGNEDLFVNVGQPINAGSRIGRLGNSDSDGNRQYSYFSVFREGIPVPPEDAPRG